MMSTLSLLLLLIYNTIDVSSFATTRDPNCDSPDYLSQAKQILDNVPLIDGHNDLAWHLMLATEGRMAGWDLNGDMRKYLPADPAHPAQTDLPRARRGRLGMQFWAAFSPCTSQYKDAVAKGLQLVDLIKRFVSKYNSSLEFVTTADGATNAYKNGRIASLIGLEGGHMIDSSLAVLRMYHDLGVRYMTLTWSCTVPWADDYHASRYNRPTHGGLTDFGRRVVREMNRMGMLVDISHVAHSTMRDTLNVTEAPVIFSHSSAFSVCPHHRNAPDDVLLTLKKNRGIIMVNFYPDFINCTKETVYINNNRGATVVQVADHIDYIKNLIGVDHVGLGSDFDGSDLVGELRDVSTYPLLFSELLRRGWTEKDLKKLASENFHRVFKEVEKVSKMKANEAPDDTLIDMNDIPDKTCYLLDHPWGH